MHFLKLSMIFIMGAVFVYCCCFFDTLDQYLELRKSLVFLNTVLCSEAVSVFTTGDRCGYCYAQVNIHN